MKKEKNVKKIVFDPKTDSLIEGFALVIAFVFLGIMLEFNKNYFGGANNVVKITFIVIGVLGLFTEVSNLNLNYNIKGLDNIGVGIFLMFLIYLMEKFINTSSWFFILEILYEAIVIILLLICIYAFSIGVIQMFYSLYLNYKSKNTNKKRNLFSGLIVILSQLLGLALIVAQIYDIFNK